MSVYELSENATQDSSVKPPSPYMEENPQWYVDNIKYALSHYNQPIFVNGRLSFLKDNNGADMGRGVASGYESTLPVQEMIRNLLYYFGRQPNLNYAYLTGNVDKPNLQASWIKGQKISRLVDFLTNNIKTMISNGQWEAENISPRAKGKKSEMISSLMMMYEMKPFFEDMANNGVNQMMANGQDFKFPEEIYRWMETDYKEETGELMSTIGRGLWERSGWSYKAYQAARYLICTNIACAEHIAINGIHQWELFPSYQLIWDTRKDDDYNKDGMFRGRITASTAAAIIKKYPFNETQRQTIEDFSRDNTLGEPINVLPNMTWWNYNQSYNSVSEVTVYFKAIREIKRGKEKNRYGNERMIDLQDGGFGVLDVFKGTIVGGKYLVNYGPVSNIVEDRNNCSIPELPISIFCPNMMLSQYRSTVSRLVDLQDEIDALKYKVREMVGRAKGKSYVIRGNKMTGNVDVQEVFEDISSINLTVINNSGEVGGSGGPADKLVETVDLTLDPNIQRIWELANLEAQEMEEIVAASKAALGQQTRYIGQATLQQNITQSSIGMAYIIDGFMDWIQKNMQYAVDMQKDIIAAGKCNIAEFWVGDRGIEFLKLIRQYRTESFLMALNINDPFTESDKKEMTAMVQAFVQNGLFEPIDYFTLKTLKTKSEIVDYFEYATKKRKREAQEAEAAKQAAEDKRLNNQLATQEAISAASNQTKEKMQDKEIYADVATKTMDMQHQRNSQKKAA